MTENDSIINANSDGTKPIYKILPSTKKVRPDDKRGPNHNHPISKKKRTPEEKKEFCRNQFRPKWSSHPIKEQILKWFEDGFTAHAVVDKISARAMEDKASQEDYSLSIPTLLKIRRRHLRGIGALKTEEVQSRLATLAHKEFTESEKVLWKTVQDCTEKKKDTSISPKDWQYYDQQQQSALQLLNSLKGEGKSGEDIAIVISRVFAQFFKQFHPSTNGTKTVPSGAADNAGKEESQSIRLPE